MAHQTNTPPAPPELAKAPEAISGMFNRIARTYDFLNDCMSGGMHRLWKQQACKALCLEPGSTVLDVCTGTGDLAAILAQMVGPAGQVYAVDFSQAMLEVARKRFAHIPNITWVYGDALALPFEDNRFDGAIISFGLRNVASVEKALGEMVRVIKPQRWVVNLDTASDCKNPLFWFYFSVIMPFLGQLFSSDPTAYRYLCQSTRMFETPSEITAHLIQHGLVNTQIRYFGFGGVSYQAGLKPDPPANILLQP